MADTCGTLVKAASVLIDQGGAKDAIAIVTHGILSGTAIEALNGSRLKKIVVTNTVPHEEKKEICDRIETIDISPTVSEHVKIDKNLLPNGLDSLPRPADVPTTERVCLSSSSMRPLINPLYPTRAHAFIYHWRSGVLVKTTLRLRRISGCLDDFNELLLPQHQDLPPHGEATAVKEMRRCRTKPALVKATFRILSHARPRQNIKPLSKSLTSAAKRHMFCKCVYCTNLTSCDMDRTGQTLSHRQTSQLHFKCVRYCSTAAAFPIF